jgi:hypothetical protein
MGIAVTGKLVEALNRVGWEANANDHSLLLKSKIESLGVIEVAIDLSKNNGGYKTSAILVFDDNQKVEMSSEEKIQNLSEIPRQLQQYQNAAIKLTPPSPKTSNESLDEIKPEETQPNISLVKISDKAFMVVGETKPLKDKLGKDGLKGLFKKNIKGHVGWMFPLVRLEEIEAELGVSLKDTREVVSPDDIKSKIESIILSIDELVKLIPNKTTKDLDREKLITTDVAKSIKKHGVTNTKEIVSENLRNLDIESVPSIEFNLLDLTEAIQTEKSLVIFNAMEHAPMGTVVQIEDFDGLKTIVSSPDTFSIDSSVGSTAVLQAFHDNVIKFSNEHVKLEEPGAIPSWVTSMDLSVTEQNQIDAFVSTPSGRANFNNIFIVSTFPNVADILNKKATVKAFNLLIEAGWEQKGLALYKDAFVIRKEENYSSGPKINFVSGVWGKDIIATYHISKDGFDNLKGWAAAEFNNLKAENSNVETMSPSTDVDNSTGNLFEDTQSNESNNYNGNAREERIAAGEIQDYGEYVPGARKELYGKIYQALEQEIDIATVPLSKSLPVPDYEKLEAAGVPKEDLAMIASLRGVIDRKPTNRYAYKVARWVKSVSTARAQIKIIFDSKGIASDLIERMKSTRELDAFAAQVKLFSMLPIKDLHDISSKITLEKGKFYSVNGVNYNPPAELIIVKEMQRGKSNLPGLVNFQTMNKDFLESDYEQLRDQITESLETLNAKSPQERTKKSPLKLYRNRQNRSIFVGFNGSTSEAGVIHEFDTGIDIKTARIYLENHNDELLEKLKTLKTNDMRETKNRNRAGPVYRSGDVTQKEFTDKFGLKGVQFGKSLLASQNEAQGHINRAYDSLMDLSSAIGINPEAIGLASQLSLAFGARGSGGNGSAAHYEPDKMIINLTRTSGPGSLAHEWFHAFDHYLSRISKTREEDHDNPKGFGMITEASGDRLYALRDKLAGAVESLQKGVEGDFEKSSFKKEAEALDSFRTKKYYSTTVELMARSFERYIFDKLDIESISNDYLVNIIATDTGVSGLYPTTEQMNELGISDAYESLFDTLEEKTVGNKQVLYRIEPEYADVASAWITAAQEDQSLIRYPETDHLDVIAVFKEAGYDLRESKALLKGTIKDQIIESNDLTNVYLGESVAGNTFYIFEAPSRIWIDVSNFGQESDNENDYLVERKGGVDNGSEIYHLVSNYALNTGRKCIVDPVGVSNVGMVRFTESMMSSAIRFGTTKHLQPSQSQINGYADRTGEYVAHPVNWGDDDQENIAALLKSSYLSVLDNFPEIEHIKYDPVKSSFVAVDSLAAKELTDKLNQKNTLTPDSLHSKALTEIEYSLGGSSTLKRAIITQTIIRKKSRNLTASDAAELMDFSNREGNLNAILYRHAELIEDVGQKTIEVKSWISKTEQFTGVDVEVVPSAKYLPEHLQKNLPRKVAGLYDTTICRPYIIADRVSSKEQAIKICIHEGLGHAGLVHFLNRNEEFGGASVNELLDSIYKDLTDDVKNVSQEYNFDFGKENDRRTAVLEYIAIISETKPDSALLSAYNDSATKLMNELYEDEINWERKDILNLIEASRQHTILEKSLDTHSSQLKDKNEEIFTEVLGSQNIKLKSLLKVPRPILPNLIFTTETLSNKELGLSIQPKIEIDQDYIRNNLLNNGNGMNNLEFEENIFQVIMVVPFSENTEMVEILKKEHVIQEIENIEMIRLGNGNYLINDNIKLDRKNYEYAALLDAMDQPEAGTLGGDIQWLYQQAHRKLTLNNSISKQLETITGFHYDNLSIKEEIDNYVKIMSKSKNKNMISIENWEAVKELLSGVKTSMLNNNLTLTGSASLTSLSMILKQVNSELLIEGPVPIKSKFADYDSFIKNTNNCISDLTISSSKLKVSLGDVIWDVAQDHQPEKSAGRLLMINSEDKPFIKKEEEKMLEECSAPSR